MSRLAIVAFGVPGTVWVACLIWLAVRYNQQGHIL